MNDRMDKAEEIKNDLVNNKSLQWYFHPNETIRMLRYFQLNAKFDETADYTVSYSNNPTVGVVIGTYGSIAYIDLQLHYLKNVNKIDKILIHDDCSDKQEELKALADKYQVDFYSTQKQMFYKSCVGSNGDTSAFFIGLNWAKQNNIDILVKLSRRLIPCFNWVDDLKKLAVKTDGLTFSSFCEKDLFRFRTECCALNVKHWSSAYPMYCMNWVLNNEYTIFAEFWFHEISKTLSGNNYSKKWAKYAAKTPYLYSGYVKWLDILGTNRYTRENRNENVLWHMFSSSEDYYNESVKVFGEKYTQRDFQ
jgi:hypothetical protein